MVFFVTPSSLIILPLSVLLSPFMSMILIHCLCLTANPCFLQEPLWWRLMIVSLCQDLMSHGTHYRKTTPFICQDGHCRTAFADWRSRLLKSPLLGQGVCNSGEPWVNELAVARVARFSKQKHRMPKCFMGHTYLDFLKKNCFLSEIQVYLGVLYFIWQTLMK